jgi:hypothetical protein
MNECDRCHPGLRQRHRVRTRLRDSPSDLSRRGCAKTDDLGAPAYPSIPRADSRELARQGRSGRFRSRACARPWRPGARGRTRTRHRAQGGGQAAQSRAQRRVADDLLDAGAQLGGRHFVGLDSEWLLWGGRGGRLGRPPLAAVQRSSYGPAVDQNASVRFALSTLSVTSAATSLV